MGLSKTTHMAFAHVSGYKSMYMYTYTYIYIHIYIYIYIYIYHIYIYTNTHTYTHIHIHTHINIHIHMHTYTHTNTHAHTCSVESLTSRVRITRCPVIGATGPPVHEYVCMCDRVRVFARVHVYVCVLACACLSQHIEEAPIE